MMEGYIGDRSCKPNDIFGIVWYEYSLFGFSKRCEKYAVKKVDDIVKEYNRLLIEFRHGK